MTVRGLGKPALFAARALAGLLEGAADHVFAFAFALVLVPILFTFVGVNTGGSRAPVTSRR
eukprot:2161549-Pyramimonas_sp.AAC.1